MPLADVQKGMTGTGWTVREGTEPEPFAVEVLGVLPDAVGPGRALIIVDTSGPLIDQSKGIWFGMSGSPVYIDDKLVGAVSFGFSATSTVAGLTPAQDMEHILTYPAGSARASSQKVRLSGRLAARVAERTDATGGLTQLAVPLSVSGLNARGMASIRRAVDNENLPYLPYKGASASAVQQQVPDPLMPGDNFAGALTYGDVTFAGIGTTTYVCDDKVLAFGHPFSFQGGTTLGANAADAITIINDELFGPFKMATIEGLLGTVTQDRLAGIMATLGGGPTLIPVNSTVTSLPTATTRDGSSQAVISEIVPSLGFAHMLGNIDVTFDEIGEGSSELSWTFTGTKEDGTPWSMTRSNIYASEFDISFESVLEIENQLSQLFFNEFEDIEFTGVDVDATVDDEVKRYQIKKVFVGVNGGDLEATRRVKVNPGDTIELLVNLEPSDDSETVVVPMSVQVPAKTKFDGSLEIGTFQGGFFEECFFEECFDQGGNGKVESFDELLAELQNAPKNNELQAKLFMGRRFKVKSQDSELMDQVVGGFKSIFVKLKGAGGGVVSEPIPAKEG